MSNDNENTQETCEWESRALGADESYVGIPADNSAIETSVDESMGLQMISIRLPKSLIEDFKTIAKFEGLGYQPLMRIALTRFADAEFKRYARNMMSQEETLEVEVIDDCGDDSTRKVA